MWFLLKTSSLCICVCTHVENKTFGHLKVPRVWKYISMNILTTKPEKSVFLYIRGLYMNKHLYKYNPPNIGFYIQFWNMVIHLDFLTSNHAGTNRNISGCSNTHRICLFCKVGTDFSCCICTLLMNKLSGKVKLEQHSLWCSNISNCKFLAIHKPQFWNRKKSLINLIKPVCFAKKIRNAIPTNHKYNEIKLQTTHWLN